MMKVPIRNHHRNIHEINLTTLWFALFAYKGLWVLICVKCLKQHLTHFNVCVLNDLIASCKLITMLSSLHLAQSEID